MNLKVRFHQLLLSWGLLDQPHTQAGSRVHTHLAGLTGAHAQVSGLYCVILPLEYEFLDYLQILARFPRPFIYAVFDWAWEKAKLGRPFLEFNCS